MADEKTQAAEGGEEELQIVEVDKLPDPNADPKPAEDEDKGEPPADAGSKDDGDEGDDDEDEGDARLGSDDEGDRAERAERNREKRRERREVQKRARERLERELADTKAELARLAQQVGSVQSHTVQTTLERIQADYQQTLRDIRDAEAIEAEALSENNGQAAVQARNIREAASARKAALEQQYTQIAAPPQPQVDPRVVENAKEWQRANPWYQHDNDTDPVVALTKQIDVELVRSGSNPASREHWAKLTERLNEALKGDDNEDRAPPKRKAPPTGGGREHAPPTTRNEIHVTPERKQAMIDAGAWDDPVLRKRFLKAYQDFDRNAASR